MSRDRIRRRGLMLAMALPLALATPAAPQVERRPARPGPRLEPVAETRLLMEGLAASNFRGLDRLLRQQPANVETWTFIRGQALLIAETGNLLMLRPPRNPGQDAWMERSTELRDAATALARAAAAKDFDRSQKGLVALVNACNRCHQGFRVPVQITPFADPEERKKTD